MKVPKKSYLLALCIFISFLIKTLNGNENPDKIQETKINFHEIKIVTGEYANNITNSNVNFVEKFYSNVLCDSFEKTSNQLFETLLDRIGISILMDNYFKNTFEAKSIDEANYFYESATEEFSLTPYKNDLEFEYCQEKNESFENDIKVKFFYYVRNCLLNINKITNEIKKHVETNETNNSNLDIESVTMSIKIRLMNNLNIFLRRVQEKNFQITKFDLQTVQLIEKILENLNNHLGRDQLMENELVRESKERIIYLERANSMTQKSLLLVKSKRENIIQISKMIKESSRLIYNLLDQLKNTKFNKHDSKYLNLSLKSIETFVASSNDFLQILKKLPLKSFTDEYEKRISSNFLKISENYNDYLELFSQEKSPTEKEVTIQLIQVLSKFMKSICDITDKIVTTLKTLEESTYDFSIQSIIRFNHFTLNSTSELVKILQPLNGIYSTNNEINEKVNNLHSVAQEFLETEDRRRGLYEARIPMGEYTSNLINSTVRHGQNFQNSCQSVNDSQFKKSFLNILERINNTTLMINNYEITMSSDFVGMVKFVSKNGKRLFHSLQNDKLDLCEGGKNFELEHDVRYEFFNDVVNVLLNAENVTDKTKNNVQRYIGMTEDILNFESTSLITLSVVMEELRLFLQGVKEKEFRIIDADRRVVILMTEILERIIE